MTDFTLTRRTFLGGLCAAPLIASLPVPAREVEAEFELKMFDCEPIVLTTYVDGGMEASYLGQQLTALSSDKWGRVYFEGRAGEDVVACVCRRLEPFEVEVDSCYIYSPKDTHPLLPKLCWNSATYTTKDYPS